MLDSLYRFIQTFFVLNGYVFEVVFTVCLFCFFFEKKKYFILRFAAVFLVMLGLSVLWQVGYQSWTGSIWFLQFYYIFKYMCFFGISVLGILFCVRANSWSALFCSVGALATQHIAYKVYAIILALAGMGYDSAASFFINLAVMVVVYSIIYFILVRKVRSYPEECFKNRINILLGGIFIATAIFLHFLSEPFVSMEETPALFIFVSLYSIVCSVCTLLLEYGFAYGRMVLQDNAVLTHLVHQQEEQYQMAKDNIEMINIKCHDMKHQISQLVARKGSAAVEEMERIINIYDSSIQTGNEILDAFLAEKKLLCEKNKISFDCLVDGKSLSFLPPTELYALFGNVLDNAIEAVSRMENEDKRIIGLSVKKQLNLIIIHEENFYEGELHLQDGILPKTTKDRTAYHGYGLRSIQMIVEKYDGNMTLSANKGIFNLNIAIPIDNIG